MKYPIHITILVCLLVGCSPSSEEKHSDNPEPAELEFSVVEGVNEIQDQTIEIDIKGNQTILITTYGSNWKNYTEYKVVEINDSTITLLPLNNIGIGLCKSGNWGLPILGIGCDTNSYKTLKNAVIKVNGINLDTNLQLSDRVSYYDMPSSIQEKGEIKIHIALDQHPNYVFDTLSFDYYRTMICAYGLDETPKETELIITDSIILFNRFKYSIVKKAANRRYTPPL